MSDAPPHAELVRCATNGRAERAQALLDDDPELARAGLDVALVLGDRASVAEALELDPGVAGRELGERRWLPLLYPCHSAFLGSERTDGLLACAELLLDAGADPDSSWRHPEFGALSALYGAAGVAHEPRMTALLLERGATPDDDESLYHSCESRDHACLALLLDAGARVAGTNALGHMLDYDDPEGLRLLVERGVEQEGRGWPELEHAIAWALSRERSRAHVELLLAHGAAVGPGDATLAVRRGRADLADLLGPASPSPADELVGAARRADRETVDAVLAAHPGLLDRLVRGDHDVLVHVAGTGNRAGTELLLDLGFPIGIRSEEFEETPLHAAAWSGRAGIVRLLLDRGADPNVQAGKPFGGTTLDWAAHGSRNADPAVFNGAPKFDHRATAAALLAAGGALSRDWARDEATTEVAALLG